MSNSNPSRTRYKKIRRKRDFFLEERILLCEVHIIRALIVILTLLTFPISNLCMVCRIQSTGGYVATLAIKDIWLAWTTRS